MESRHKVADSRKPKKLHTCKACGQVPASWDHSGTQSYPAHYAKATTFKAGLDSGLYTWSADRSKFGVDLFDCSECKGTFPDSR